MSRVSSMHDAVTLTVAVAVAVPDVAVVEVVPVPVVEEAVATALVDVPPVPPSSNVAGPGEDSALHETKPRDRAGSSTAAKPCRLLLLLIEYI